MIAAAVVLVWLTYLIRAFRWRTLLAPLAATVAGLVALAWLRRHAGAATRWLDTKLETTPRVFVRPGKIFVGLLGQTAQALGVLADARGLLIVVGWTAALWAAITIAN